MESPRRFYLFQTQSDSWGCLSASTWDHRVVKEKDPIIFSAVSLLGHCRFLKELPSDGADEVVELCCVMESGLPGEGISHPREVQGRSSTSAATPAAAQQGKAASERAVAKTSGDTSHLACSTPCTTVFVLPLNWQNPSIC